MAGGGGRVWLLGSSGQWFVHEITQLASSASGGIQSRAVLFSWILSKFLRVVRRNTKKTMDAFFRICIF